MSLTAKPQRIGRIASAHGTSGTGKPQRTGATLAIVSLALFMVVLDNLIVTVALPAIREDLGATLQSLEWTINAYTLAFAVTLIPGAALGDRFGRKNLFLAGLALFTAASAAAALSPTTGALVAARAVQGIGGAVVAPLTLTLLADAFPAQRRGAALGIWSGISGTGIALGPLVGGAVVEGMSWHWIFWINVPIGIALLPVAALLLRESHGQSRRLDLPGVGLASTGLFSLVFGLVRGQGEGWTSPTIVAALAAGVVLLAAFVAWERRTPEPMVPMSLFGKRTFAVTNAVSFFMYFGTFGSIFLLTQILQNVLGYSPFQAGLRMLVWTGASMLVAPAAGILAERYGARTFMAVGLALQAGALSWFAATTAVDQSFSELIVPFAMAGTGMALVFAPSASALLSVVTPAQAGQASGTNNAIREVGGVFGVAVLSTIFSQSGSLASLQSFVDGAVPALWVGAAVVALGSVVALLLPRGRAVVADAQAVPVAA
jgi:EmrB/QacA subfamily drug resistance transporter